MKSEVRQYIGIIGGFWEIDERLAERAKQFAVRLGAELAKAGLGIVVYNSDDKSLEPHVVAGYASATPAGSGGRSIRIKCAQSQRESVQFKEETERGDLFQRFYFPGQDWEAPFYRSLVDAEGVEGVVVMAGARTTLVAAQIAIARRMPLLALDQFDGTAAMIWRELAAKNPDYPSSADEPAALVAWLKRQCAAQAMHRDQSRSREAAYLRTASQLRKTAWAGGAFIVLLAAVLVGFGRAPAPESYIWITLLGLTAAGATGALIRSLISRTEETGSAASLLLGAVAGFVVGLAYLIPQWVGAHGVLDASSAVQPEDKIQFASALLVAVSAGVGFDTVFTRLRKEAETQPIGARP